MVGRADTDSGLSAARKWRNYHESLCVKKNLEVVGYVDVPEPRLTPYGAILRPVAVAPCSSDVHTVFGGGSRKAPNLVLGHEVRGGGAGGRRTGEEEFRTG